MRRPPIIDRLTAAAVAVLVGGALGCTGEPASGVAVVERWVEDEPAEVFRRERVLESRVVATWRFEGPEMSSVWELNVPPDQWQAGSAGLRLEPEKQYVLLERPVDIEAADVDAFELLIEGLARKPVAVEWAGPGQAFSSRRRVQVDLGIQEESRLRRHRLALAGHPGWQGPVERIRFALVIPRDGVAVVDRVELLRESVDPELLEDALGRAWRIELGGELRSALVAPDDRPLSRTVQVPEDAVLELGVGAERVPEEGLEFAVTAMVDGESAPILVERVTQVDRWRDLRLDLARYGGRRIDLELEVRGGYDRSRGLAAWSSPELVAPAGTRRPNVVLILIDTLRADRLSCYGWDRETTPAIDRYAARRGVVFEHVVAPAPWTLPSHVSLFTALDATRHGVNHQHGAPEGMTMLAERLRAEGYATAAMTGGGFLHQQYGFAQGFDRYAAYDVGMGHDEELETGVERALGFLEDVGGRPFFLFFHTYEVHNPFRPRQPYLERLTGRTTDLVVDVVKGPQERQGAVRPRRGLAAMRDGALVERQPDDLYELALDLYDAGIAYTDHHVGRLLDRLEASGVADDTVVVITSDHGELFGEHGHVNHYTLYRENLLVPLVVAAPDGRRAVERVTRQVRLVDVTPTILELVGLDVPAGLDGVSLVPLLDGRAGPERLDVALSYAASSNWGLAVRRDGVGQLTIRNDAWSDPTAPVEELAAVDADGPAPRPAAADELRNIAEEVLEGDMPALRIRIANRTGRRPMSGTIEGPAIHMSRVKSTGIGCRCLERRGGSRARFEVPPGEVITVALEAVPAGALQIVVEPAGPRSGTSVAIDPERLDRPFRAALREGSWVMGPEVGDGEDGVVAWWHHRPEAQVSFTGEVDPEVRAQLEALGYVE